GRQYFFYDRFDELDFASIDARAGLAYSLPKLNNLQLRADYLYNRLTDEGSFDAFFTSHALAFGAELPFRIGRAQQVSIGTDVSLNLDSDPDGPGRHDFSAFLGYSVNLTRALTISAVARVIARNYTDSDRTDVSGILAVSATYRFTKWLSANAVTTLVTNDSDQDVFDYDVANAGVALSFGLRF
ncbi:MAG TPA: outer membrane beta-barrel protein, partial [Chthoniobacterales bacterium]|nr:outer membrane beta-barrel protein [Chthoniobacterales bacterium]